MSKVQTATQVTIKLSVTDVNYGDYDEALESFQEQFTTETVDETPTKKDKTNIEIKLIVQSEDYKAYEEALDNFTNSFEHEKLDVTETEIL